MNPRSNDRGSLPAAMLLIIIGLGLSGLLAATVGSQITGTRSTIHSSEAIDAAQTGIDVALGHIRIATNSDGTGNPAALPCGPFTGSVNAATDQTYTVSIYYLRTQPPAGDVAWAAANRMACTSTYLTGSETPVYVLLSSTGKALSNDVSPRTVTATYTLHSKTRENIAGGLIHILGNHTPDLCFSAPGTTPAAGAALTLQVCDSNDDKQKFAYVSNLNLVLTASRATGGTGMCLDAAPNQNEQVVFRACAATTAERQQWSLNDRANFEGTKNGDKDRQCFHVVNPGQAGSTIVLHAVASDPSNVSQYDAACDGDYTITRSFQPDAAAGTGGAGEKTNQLVNFEQFGRCLDVSADNTSAAYMVIWPCKQSPTGTVQWNQVWHLPAIATGQTSGTGVIWLANKYGVKYCLTSPGRTGYPTLVTCNPSATPTAALTWTRRGNTGVFGNAYRIETTYNAPAGTTWCLAPTDATVDAWTTGTAISKGTLAVCDGSRGQKWNADPMVLSSAITDVSEK
ncbi:ricin-type beta-trefoil lectin domain protein [Winogradskya humida]|uniref:Ig-like domain-containing protein n=1 Tax=Winogradskya humida TaxID=113566 RepID=A0ABQ4A0Q4_9ACTN|nr:ricin-type beta-trefoil lectin domain protein [Actinoplanes humidus]GIE24422.1 hypothetical protein Ahu01nite_075240 [Actinoplanes humidus]